MGILNHGLNRKFAVALTSQSSGRTAPTTSRRGGPMKALTWHGKADMRCEEVPDPKLEDPRDAIIKVTSCAICGSDLHIYGGIIPSMKSGDIVGHETMGEVVEVGPGAKSALK